MNGDNEQAEKQFRTLRIITYAMLVVAPIAYLLAALFLDVRGSTQGTPNSMTIYLFLILAVGIPAIFPLVARSQIQTYRSNKANGTTSMEPISLFQTLSIIAMAFVEACYIYGFVSFILTGELANMLYFYPIGIIWSFVHWPRRSKYEQLIERLSRP